MALCALRRLSSAGARNDRGRGRGPAGMDKRTRAWRQYDVRPGIARTSRVDPFVPPVPAAAHWLQKLEIGACGLLEDRRENSVDKPRDGCAQVRREPVENAGSVGAEMTRFVHRLVDNWPPNRKNRPLTCEFA